MLELKEGVNVIRIRDYYYFVDHMADGSIQIERFGECWRCDTLADVLQAMKCEEADVTQFKIEAI